MKTTQELLKEAKSMKITQELLQEAIEEVKRGGGTELYEWIKNFGTKQLIKDIWHNEPQCSEAELNNLIVNSTDVEEITNTITYLKHNRKRILVFLYANVGGNAVVIDLKQLENPDFIKKLEIFTQYGYQVTDKGNAVEIKKKGEESGIEFKIYAYKTEINEILRHLPELFRFDKLIDNHCYTGKYFNLALETSRDIIRNNYRIIKIYTSLFPDEEENYKRFFHDMRVSLNPGLVYGKFKGYVTSTGSKERQRHNQRILGVKIEELTDADSKEKQKQRFEEVLGVKIEELTDAETLKNKKLVEYKSLLKNRHTPEELLIAFKILNMLEKEANRVLDLAKQLR